MFKMFDAVRRKINTLFFATIVVERPQEIGLPMPAPLPAIAQEPKINESEKKEISDIHAVNLTDEKEAAEAETQASSKQQDNTETILFSAEKTFETEAIQQLEQARQMCISRKTHYEKCKEYYQKASLSELRTFYLRFTSINPSTFSETTCRDELCNMYLAYHISLYEKAIQYIEAGKIDFVYMILKMALAHDPYKQKIKRNKTARKEKERYFYNAIIGLVTPFISRSAYMVLKKGYIVFDSHGIGKNYMKLLHEEVGEFSKKLSAVHDCFKVIYNGQALHLRSKRHELFLTVEKPKYFQSLEQLKTDITAQYTRYCSEQSNIHTFDDHMTTIFAMYDLYLKVRKTTKPMRDTLKKLKKEADYHQICYKVSTKEHPSIVNHIQQIRPRYFSIIDKIKELLPHLDQTRQAFYETIEQDLFTHLANATYFSRTIVDRVSQLRTLLEQSPSDENDTQCGYFVYCIEKNIAFCKQIIKVFNVAIDDINNILAKEQPQSKTVFFAAPAEKTSAETPQPSKKTRAKPQEQKPKILTLEEWKAECQAQREKGIVEKDKRRRAAGEASILAINEANLAKKMKTLTDEDIKIREERVMGFLSSSMVRTDDIKTAFEAIFSDEFGHQELMALVKILKDNGENIDIIRPEGGSSHYTIKIRGSITFFEDEERGSSFDESGKAFTPHAKNKRSLPNAKYFPRHIMESIQSVFCRAGYTPTALGVQAPARFDVSKYR